ncbi:hypothetical protein BH18THE1_BH18THE1_22600 [soil metagenome]
MSELEICPVCKQGHLYLESRAGDDLESKHPFRETSSMRDLICDYCGHKQKNAGLKEYGGPETGIVSGVIPKADPEEKLFACDCGASFKTDEELLKHHQSEHGK